MEELEKRVDELEMKLLKDVTNIAKDSGDIWKTIGKLGDMLHEAIADIRALKTDVDKLIENSCGCKKSA